MMPRPLLSLRPRARAAAHGALASAALVLAAQGPQPLRDLSAPKPEVALEPAALPAAAKTACASCHADVAAEWAATAHALAWVDTHYVEALKEKSRPETCHGCHAPKPLLAAGPQALASKPAARDEARELGVTCESCHLGPDGVILGPRGTPTEAHRSQASETFTKDRSNALCGACHRFNIGPVIGIAKDFEQAKLAERGLSCLGCHTHEVEIAFANAPAGAGTDAAAVPARKGRSHAIQTPRDPTFLRRAFGLSLRAEGGKTVVSVANLAGHRVPGLIGRSIEIEARVLDAGGQELGRKTLRLDAGSYLPVEKSLDIQVPAVGAAVAVVGSHLDPRAPSAIRFLDERLAYERR